MSVENDAIRERESGVDELARGTLWFVRRLWWVAVVLVSLMLVGVLVSALK